LRKIDKKTGLVNVTKGQEFLSKNESKKQEPIVNEETCRVVRSVDEFEEWLDVYTTSFEIDIERRTTIRTRLQRDNFRESKFILYVQKPQDKTNRHNLRPVGCCLLFPTNDVLGLYCLGTDQRFRNMGIATSLLNFAITYAKVNGFNLLGLQALHSDHIIGFYQRRYFTTLYTDAIFSVPIS
jgi:GNAT superfamily N-acetyltransferase